LQFFTLNHGAHGAVKNHNTLTKRLPQQLKRRVLFHVMIRLSCQLNKQSKDDL
jgi:hypothetical protein